MADYYPLIAKAVTGLDKSTGEARRAVYERARGALVAQLRSMTPALSESEITRERLALEEAIRKVEAEAARRMRAEPKGEAPRAAEPPARPDDPPAAPSRDPRDSAPGGGGAPRPARNRLFERSQLTDKGLRGFRDVVAEAEGLGEKTAQASKSARAAYAAVPTNIPEIDRVEPRVEPEGLRSPPRETPARRPSEPSARQDSRQGEARQPESRQFDPRQADARQADARQADARYADPRQADARQVDPRYIEARAVEPRYSEPAPQQDVRQAPPRKVPPHPPQAPLSASRDKPPHSRKGLVAALVSLAVIFGLAATLFLMRDRLPGWIGTVRSLAPQAQKDAPRPKIPDRIGQDGQLPAPPSTPGSNQGNQQTAAVAQRVVLYEEDPADPAGKRYVGSAIWRTEMVTPVQGQPPELAVRCDVEIPDRRIAMTMSMRRNTDPALPASHTVEIMFNLPADFPFGGITNVPGILMKQAEQTRGAPLAGLTVKVTTGFFLIGLSSAEAEMQRNLQLLKERAWFDIPVVYNNGRRAILAVEKGNPGERAFADAFAAWKQ